MCQVLVIDGKFGKATPTEEGDMRLRYRILTVLVIGAAFLAFAVSGYAQEPLGGPYTEDGNTVVLMHFDSTYANQSTLEVSDGEPIGDVYFQENSVREDLGPSVYFNNLNGEDNYIAVADTPALDLAHEFTLEAWFRPDTFDGTYNVDARILFKPGDPFYYSNWYLAPYADGHMRTGFRRGTSGWHNMDSPDGIITEDNWYHVVFIKDTARKKIAQILTDANGELLNFQVEDEPDPAQTGNGELRIGRGNSESQRWIGSMDEVRISNNVRQYNYPLPMLTYVEDIGTVSPGDGPYEVKAVVENPYGSGDLSATLEYDIGAGWIQVPMTPAEGDTFVAEIPNQEIPGAGAYRILYEGATAEHTVSRQSGSTSFQIEAPEQKVLALTFEEGEGAPMDTTGWHDSMMVHGGDTTYTSDAAAGNYAYTLDGQDDYLELQSNILKLPVVTVDMWFRVNEFQDTWKPVRLLSKMGDWWPRANYAIHLESDSSITAFTYVETNDFGNTEDALRLDSTLTTGQWYHVIFSVKTDAAFLQLRDVNDEVIDTKTTTLPGPITMSDNSLVIGRAGDPPSENDNQPYFNGDIDNVSIYNYPAFQGPPIITHVDQLGPQKEETASYPVEANIRASGAGPMEVNLYYAGEFGFIQNPMSEAGEGTNLWETAINGQPGGSLVPYYVKATVGEYEASYPENAEADSNFFKFGVKKAFSKTLDLSFNEGSGLPHDSSMYGEHHQLVPFGAPQWSTDAAEGPYSAEFEGDTSHYEILEPYFVSSEQFTLDFWFKADSNVSSGDRMIIKASDDPARNFPFPFGTFHVRTIGNGQQISAWSTIQYPDGDEVREKMDFSSEFDVDKWYRFILEVREDSLMAQLRDSSNQVVEKQMRGFSKENGHARVDMGPVRIGQGGFGGHHWPGKIDKVQIYNFPVTATAPLMSDVTDLSGSQVLGNAPYTVEATIEKPGGQIVSATLHYRVNDGDWETTEMMSAGNSIYSADIPQQSKGAVVDYFISAEDAYQNVSNVPEGGDYYSFGIWEEHDQTLVLDFEEGEGVPQDSTAYNQPVTVYNKALYSRDRGAANGYHGFLFDSDEGNYLEIDSPILLEEEYTVDFWFRVDSMAPNVRIMSKQGGGVLGPWWQPSFQIFIWDTTGILRAASYIQESGLNGGAMELSKPIEKGTWYNANFTFSGDTSFFQIRTKSGALYDSVSAVNEGPPRVTYGPMRIGHAGADAQPYFDGVVDYVRIYNYATAKHNQFPVGTADERMLPDQFALSQNYPNPFNPTTRINYDLPKEADVNITIYDLLGQEVKTLVNKQVKAGYHTVEWDATNSLNQKVSSGVYFYRIEAGDFTEVKKMVLLR